jgi:23S rRNA (cytidine1920-2'-O)/16S rRNA (cytidine1409-2'-O)-methyltransferase
MPHRKIPRTRFVALTARLARDHPDLADPDDIHALICGAQVVVNGVIITNPAAQVAADAAVTLRRPHDPRGRRKLAAALERFSIPVTSRVAVDLGASTGGFTLALLAAGAQRVYAVDAGHGQLLGRLRNHPRVVNLENTNLGELSGRHIPEPAEVITADLSYLALAEAAPELEVLDIAANADLVVLVKPMYELGLAAPPADEVLEYKAVELATTAFDRRGWERSATMPSPVPGRHGAVEYLVHLRRREGRA